MAVLFDSNVWIGLIDEDDALHAKAEHVAAGITGKIIVPYSVALEVANLLTLRLSKTAANNFLFEIVNNRDIEVVGPDFAKEVVFFASFDQRMAFTDYALIALARDKGYRLITFDKKMQSFLDDPKNDGQVVFVN